VNVVQDIAGLIHKALLIARDTHEHAEFQQEAAHPDQRPPLTSALERERESAACKIGVRRGFQQTFTQGAQRDLGFGAFEHRTGEAQQHVSILVEVREAARRIVDGGGPLVEAGTLTLHLQIPSSLPPKPVP